MKSTAILTACSLLAMPAAAIEITGGTWTLTPAELEQCAAVSRDFVRLTAEQAFRAGLEHQAKQCGSRT